MKSKILTRFELFCNGEAQRVGFLQGLEDTGLPEDTQSALVYNFNKELKMPPRNIFKRKVGNGKYIASYFTQEGLKKFNTEIKNVIKAINDDGIYTVGKIITNKEEHLTLYEDEYQVIQISKDLSDISSAVTDKEEDGQYIMIDNTFITNNIRINKIELQRIASDDNIKQDIIVRPFYLEGEMIYSIDLTKSIVTISNETIY